ncbi:MAG: cyclopropane fatty acyl phospholipid synthase [Gammaproteobacteria bacterium]|nr:cyclopropane fatty acyl phospholipid synthase [Gammaproteobacteria bacterium]
MSNLNEQLEQLLHRADISMSGSRPWDLKVYNDNFFTRIFSEGSLALGEGYMDGWWDAESVDEFICKILSSDISKSIKPYKILALSLQAKLINLQNLSRSVQVAESHYNLGNRLFEIMLDKRLTYTCGYWKNATDLDTAQEAKLDLVCRKLNLEKGQHILDIGCGWGSFAKFAAENYGVEVTGITISEEQANYAKQDCKDFPINIVVQDYRLLEGKFDHIVSLGMFEHVGSKNYRSFFQHANRCLKDEGLLLLHTIGGLESNLTPDPWIHKYIFPNGQIPSLAEVATSSEKFFLVEDMHNFGAYYDKTLMAWYNNFNAGWDELKGEYSERFYRMWKFYLQACAGAFRARDLQLWQFVMSKSGVQGVYDRVS